MSEQKPMIVVRRVKRKKAGHHGGAWKVAYADFVTAMMAFFLVMWLLGAGTREQRAAISEYFKNPSMQQGAATFAGKSSLGPGGASNSMIKLGGALDLPHGPSRGDQSGARSKEDVEKEAREEEKKRLEALMKQLQEAIAKSQALKPFKDQMLIDISPDGLRIQIVDRQNRPMFDTGSARLKPYTVAILHELARFVNTVPNKISISGHTDDAPYSSDHHYSNWELSADRANAARRALVEGGMRDDKISRVVGLAASVPFDKTHPEAAVNRRISIVVMTEQAARAAVAPELAHVAPASSSAAVPSSAAPAAAASAGARPDAGADAAAVSAGADATPARAASVALLPALQRVVPVTASIHAAGAAGDSR